ncbi:MAG: hypothetical protein M1840_009075 [Geoglossum simile]|nr:MAG: hypothetical protein M1840_009075 [Geoglossum simile]
MSLALASVGCFSGSGTEELVVGTRSADYPTLEGTSNGRREFVPVFREKGELVVIWGLSSDDARTQETQGTNEGAGGESQLCCLFQGVRWLAKLMRAAMGREREWFVEMHDPRRRRGRSQNPRV